MDQKAEVCAGFGAAVTHRIALCGGPDKQRGCRVAASDKADGGQVARAFLVRRLDGLLDEPRPGAPRRIADEQIEAVVTRTLESTPRDATHWSTRSMAEASGLSHMTVKRIWGAFGLEPHRVKTFKLSTDPLFVDKVRDIAGLYLAPPAGLWSFASTRKARFRPWTAHNPCCRCAPDRRSGEATITNATGRPPCLQRWIRNPSK